MTISRCRSSHSVSPVSSAGRSGSISMPAMRKRPLTSRRTDNRGPSTMSSRSRSSSSGSDVHATIRSTRGSSSSGVDRRPARSRMCTPRIDRRGFQPSQPVAMESIYTACPRRVERYAAISARCDSTCGNATKRTASSSAQKAPTRTSTAVPANCNRRTTRRAADSIGARGGTRARGKEWAGRPDCSGRRASRSARRAVLSPQPQSRHSPPARFASSTS